MKKARAKKKAVERKLKTNKGFTLIEVVVALAILAVIVSISYSTMFQLIRSKRLLDDRRDLERITAAVLNRMTREIQMAFSGIAVLPRPDDAENTAISTRVNLVGEQKVLSNGARGDSIRFVALEAGQYLPDGGSHSGLVQIMYRVEEDPDNPQSDRYWLVREETPVLRPHTKAFEKMMIFPISKELLSLQFKYYDGEELEWTSDWGTEPHIKLPALVEMQIKVASPEGEIQSLTTTVPLRAVY